MPTFLAPNKYFSNFKVNKTSYNHKSTAGFLLDSSQRKVDRISHLKIYLTQFLFQYSYFFLQFKLFSALKRKELFLV